MNRKRVIFRFNMVEVALALVVLAIGLSSVMVLFPVGLKASQSSVADNNLGDVAERVAAYLQAKFTSPKIWSDDGTFTLNGESSNDDKIGAFDPEPQSVPTSDKFFESDGTTPKDEKVMDGLFKLETADNIYYLYRQYSDAPSGSDSAGDGDRAVDFEAVVRVGWDTATLTKQYHTQLYGAPALLSSYARAAATGVTDPGAARMKSTPADLLKQCCRALIIEISWPADVPWANREKRIFRVEMFNENFVPYPQTTTGTGDGNNP